MEEIMTSAAGLIVKLVFAAIGLLITYYLVPWLKEKKLYSTVTKLVRGAEKLAGSMQIGKGEKKSYVIDQLKNLGIKITPFVEALIEAAVTELDLAKIAAKEKTCEGDPSLPPTAELLGAGDPGTSEASFGELRHVEKPEGEGAEA